MWEESRKTSQFKHVAVAQQETSECLSGPLNIQHCVTTTMTVRPENGINAGLPSIHWVAMAQLKNCNHGWKQFYYNKNSSSGVIVQPVPRWNTAVITEQLCIYHRVDILIKGIPKLPEILSLEWSQYSKQHRLNLGKWAACYINKTGWLGLLKVK